MENQAPETNLNQPPRLKKALAWLFRTFFGLLYHQLAWFYDWVAAFVSLGAWKTWVNVAAGYLAGPRILEIGYGPGHLQVALNQKQLCVFGVDESAEMSRISRKRLARHGLAANLTRGDALNLPFVDGCFNQAVMTFPSEFALNPVTLQELQRVLAEDGLVIVIPLAWITGKKPAHRLVAWINHISGEAPEWTDKSLEPLKQYGFDISWEMVNLDYSKVMVWKLHKL